MRYTEHYYSINYGVASRDDPTKIYHDTTHAPNPDASNTVDYVYIYKYLDQVINTEEYKYIVYNVSIDFYTYSA